ncbi:MAG: glycoside hydrolase family 95-like protein, partial [Planctomycetota bacterium]
LSGFRYRPFTLEGNFLAMEAVHAMLLSSQGGRVRIFPAVSATWPDVSFRDLRAEGGFRITAERRRGRTVRVAVTAKVDGPLRLVDPFDGKPFECDRELERTGDELRCGLKAGETVELRGGGR